MSWDIVHLATTLAETNREVQLRKGLALEQFFCQKVCRNEEQLGALRVSWVLNFHSTQEMLREKYYGMLLSNCRREQFVMSIFTIDYSLALAASIYILRS